MLLARGPFPVAVLRTPEVADAGVHLGRRTARHPDADRSSKAPTRVLESDQGMTNGDQYNQTPLLEFADEGAVIVRSVRDELIDPRVLALNPWRTFGPRAATRSTSRSATRSATARGRRAGRRLGRSAGTDGLQRRAVPRRRSRSSSPLTVPSLHVMRNWHWIPSVPLHLVDRARRSDSDRPRRRLGRHGTAELPHGARRLVRLLQPATRQQPALRQSRRPARAAHHATAGQFWLTLWAVMDSPSSAPATPTRTSCSRSPVPWTPRRTTAERSRPVDYIAKPERLQVTRGRRARPSGRFETPMRRYAVHLVAPRPSAATSDVPLIVDGLIRAGAPASGSSGASSKATTAAATTAIGRSALDLAGRAYVPLYPDLAARTEVEVGHPVSADQPRRPLHPGHGAERRHRAAPATTGRSRSTTRPTSRSRPRSRRDGAAQPDFGTQTVTLAAGEHRLLYRSAAPAHRHELPPPPLPPPFARRRPGRQRRRRGPKRAPRRRRGRQPAPRRRPERPRAQRNLRRRPRPRHRRPEQATASTDGLNPSRRIRPGARRAAFRRSWPACTRIPAARLRVAVDFLANGLRQTQPERLGH